MNVLITNSVPLNGGDEAVLRAVVQSLKSRLPDASITVLCNRLELSKKYLPDLMLAPDLEFATTSADRRHVSELYRNADIVLTSPGGYLHDFYPIEDRLRAIEVALSLGKPVILLPQSIGPFWKSNSVRRIGEVLNRVTRICVRDGASVDHLLNCGVDKSKILESADAAFLWRDIEPSLFPAREGPSGKIGLCFRVWPVDDEIKVRDTIAKAVGLCEFFLADPSRQLTFLSTCQGIDGYIDDSALALQIVARLRPDLQARCSVDRSRYIPTERIQAFGQCDAVISMRLHACILAMLGGTPAMGLGYEEKTREIFSQLNLEKYQVAFEAEGDAWLRQAERFIGNVEKIRVALPALLDRVCERAKLSLDVVTERIASSEQRNIGKLAGAQLQSERTPLLKNPELAQSQLASVIQRLRPRQVLYLGEPADQLRQRFPDIEFVGCNFVFPERPIGIPFYQCDFNRQALPADLLDLEVIVCDGTLESIDDLPEFLTQLRSRLRHDGSLIVASESSGAPRLISRQDVEKALRDTSFQVDEETVEHSIAAMSGVHETLATPFAARPAVLLDARPFLVVARCDSSSAISSPAQMIGAVVPPRHSFILVDEEQWADEVFVDRRAIPFLERDGDYWGPPPDDLTAINELDRLRHDGAQFMVFGSPAFWWLEYYSGLHRHLKKNFRCILQNERLVVFDLRA
jgi:polysaccharide pyruvyl transferase WcaK-like protein